MKKILLLVLISFIFSVSASAQTNNYLFPVVVNGKWGFINYTGEIKIKPQFDSAGYFKSGFAPASKNKIAGFIDENGEFIFQVPPNYNFVNFNDELIAVIENNLYGYINKRGEVVVQPQYIYAGDFSNGIARVRSNKGFGFINQDGKLITKFYESAFDFSEGLANVKIGDKMGYINSSDNILS